MKLKRGVMRAAELADLQWINSKPFSLSDLRGGVALIHFWDYSCINCLRALSYLKVWHGRYGDKGLSVLGVHAPEFPFGKVVSNVARAVDDLGIGFPVANDPEFTTWHAYSNRYWPASYLVDNKGYLSDYQFGEGGYGETEMSIQTLLREINPKMVIPKVMEALRPEDSGLVMLRPVTPEVYLGYSRGRIGNEEGFVPNRVVRYESPREQADDVFYVQGEFSSESDCIVHQGEDEGRIVLSYDAMDVYIVVEPGGAGSEQGFFVRQDNRMLAADEFGESVTDNGSGPVVAVNTPRLYHIVHNAECSRHRLVLSTKSPGLRFYCISFVGSCAG